MTLATTLDQTPWFRQWLDLLKKSEKISLIWEADSEDIHINGHLGPLLDKDETTLTFTKTRLAQLINPQDLAVRMFSVCQAVDAVKSGLPKQNYSVIYRLRLASGESRPMREEGVVESNARTGQVMIRAVLSALEDLDISAAPAGHAVAPLIHGMSRGRRDMLEYLDEALHRGAAENRSEMPGFLLLVGLTQPGQVSEIYGADGREEIITSLGNVLKQNLQGASHIVRLDHDTYGVLYAQANAASVESLPKAILRTVAQGGIPFRGRGARVALALGSVMLSTGGKDSRQILAGAEHAFMTARQAGQTSFFRYEDLARLQDDVRNAASITNDVLDALSSNRIRLAFQPIMGAYTKRVSFHEALIRMVTDEDKIMAAGKFMPAVERHGFASAIDRAVVRMALDELSHFSDLKLSVNISRQTFSDFSALDEIFSLLNDDSRSAQRLIFEVTETSPLQDQKLFYKTLETMKTHGAKVALDDFGAGHTAYAHLRDLEIDMIKIDKSYVRNMTNPENHHFIKSLQRLAETRQIETVGEGAETHTEAKQLAADGISHIQGFFYGLPSLERTWLPEDHALRDGGTKIGKLVA